MIQYELDKEDNILVSFTQDVLYPENFKDLKGNSRRLYEEHDAQDFFVIKLELGDSTNSTLYELEEKTEIRIYWEVEILNLSEFKVKTRFDPPGLVSTDGLDPDKITF